MIIEKTDKMKIINEFFKDFDYEWYYVGGCVRDLVMGREPEDYDLFTSAEPDDIEKYIKSKGRRAYKIGKRFGTLGVTFNGKMVEITTYREETYDMSSRKPNVVFTEDVKKDIKRRDFTINGLYMDSSGEVIDIVGGLADIKHGIIRAIGIPKHRFKEDPLRILRGVRFASRYSFSIEELTFKKMKSCRWEMTRLSKERMVAEVTKMMMESKDKVSDAISILFDRKLFQTWIPELYLQYEYDQKSTYHDYTLSQHTKFVVAEVATMDGRKPKHMWAALLHDVAKPFTRTYNSKGYSNYVNHELLGAEMCEGICRRLKFSNDDREFIVESVRNHLESDCWLRPYDNKNKKGKYNE